MKRSEQALIELLDAVNRGMHEHIHAQIKGAIRDSQLRIPFPGMMIVRQVHREPGITVSELARRCGVAKSHVSKTIEGLSRQGYVEKRPDPCDQRRVQLYLSPAVTDHLARVEAMVRRLHAALIDAVPEEKREALLDGLQVLKTALEAARAGCSTELEVTP